MFLTVRRHHGDRAIQDRVITLVEELDESLRRLGAITRLPRSRDHRSGILTFELPGVEPSRSSASGLWPKRWWLAAVMVACEPAFMRTMTRKIWPGSSMWSGHAWAASRISNLPDTLRRATHVGMLEDTFPQSSSRLTQMPSPRVAVYTGSFDPITLGHLHIIRRAVALFDELVIGIGINADKKSLFEPQQRVELVRSVTGDLPISRVDVFHGLAVDFVRSIGAACHGPRDSAADRHRGRIHDDDGQSSARSRYRDGLPDGGGALHARQQFPVETDRDTQRRRQTVGQVRPARSHRAAAAATRFDRSSAAVRSSSRRESRHAARLLSELPGRCGRFLVVACRRRGVRSGSILSNRLPINLGWQQT